MSTANRVLVATHPLTLAAVGLLALAGLVLVVLIALALVFAVYGLAAFGLAHWVFTTLLQRPRKAGKPPTIAADTEPVLTCYGVVDLHTGLPMSEVEPEVVELLRPQRVAVSRKKLRVVPTNPQPRDPKEVPMSENLSLFDPTPAAQPEPVEMPPPAKPRKQARRTAAEKAALAEQARALMAAGKSRREVAHELGVPESSLRSWLKEVAA